MLKFIKKINSPTILWRFKYRFLFKNQKLIVILLLNIKLKTIKMFVVLEKYKTKNFEKKKLKKVNTEIMSV